ncbi:MAG: metal ABC transporter permease [Lachnospiraceae bacterium]|nr:metal ABC transporter permease [Lachnospiraceae bacterium]
MSNYFAELFQYDFMRRAFIAILVITPLLGILGTMIVHKKMAYFSDALGHSALTGIAIGVVLGVMDTNVSMVIFAIVFAFLLNQINRKNLAATDTIISVFASCSTAIGLAILSRGGNFSKYAGILVGDILSITSKEILYLVVIFAVTGVFWCVAVNKLNAISIHPTLAKSRNISVRLVEDIFAVIIALIVTLSIKWIGILLINALLILPAASSRNISSNMREYHGFSVLFSVFSGIIGLVISYFTNVATGPMIVIVASVIYFATYLYGKE